MPRLTVALAGWSLLGAALGALALAAALLLVYGVQAPIDRAIATLVVVGLHAGGSVGAPIGAMVGLAWGLMRWRRRDAEQRRDETR